MDYSMCIISEDKAKRLISQYRDLLNFKRMFTSFWIVVYGVMMCGVVIVLSMFTYWFAGMYGYVSDVTIGQYATATMTLLVIDCLSLVIAGVVARALLKTPRYE